jgi:hypothetical protein
MAMVCPQCLGSFEQRWNCPACGVRLAYQGDSRPARGAAAEGGAWQQTPWGRIFVGVLLAQGLYYGLRQLCTAGLLAGGDDPAGDAWSTLYGLLALQGLQAVGLIVAGLLAGAGSRQGIVYGVVVGVWNGVLSVALQGGGLPPTTVALLGQPVLHTAFGALGGFLGSCIWKPPPRLELPSGPRAPQALVPTQARPSLFSGPFAWGRIVTGAAVAVGGTLWANVLMELVLDASEGRLSINSHVQAQLVTWEVTALAMFVGGAMAGACTVNSLKQGVGVGLAAAAVLAGIRLGTGYDALPRLVLTVASSLSLGLVGAWFGGNLFPPLAPRRPRGLGPEAA